MKKNKSSILPTEYKPDYAVKPGDTIIELMCTNLAQKLRLDEDSFSSIVFGYEPITEKVAEKLEEEFGISKSFWLNLEKNYRENKSDL